MTEPCPFCGARIILINPTLFKRCPAFGLMCSEGGGFKIKSRSRDEGGAGAAAAV